jgi:phosphoribosylamine---glycine ligase
MNVLILGSGAREHAMGWKINQSPYLGNLFFSPGNPGTASLGTNLPVKTDDFENIGKAVLENNVSLLVVGPEAPLMDGIADYFSSDDLLRHVMVIGPKKAGAMLEGSKDFAKAFMIRHQIPTAAFSSFRKNELEAGYHYLESQKPPYVLKADGLAAGKGVIIHDTLSEARNCLKEMLEGKFGKASETVIIEEFLDGIELSVFVLTNGTDYVLLPEAKDYKRIGERNTGPNTGGMGAVSPVPFADTLFMQKVENQIIKPTIRGIQDDGIAYTGFIFFGLINCNGNPYVIEYNARMGDPETEVVLPRIQSDFLEMLVAAANGNLREIKPEFDKQVAATIMLVSEGYPGNFEKGKEITGCDKVNDCYLFHAGTVSDSGTLKTAGGRVIAVTATGSTMQDTLGKCYRNAEMIDFKGKYCRRDIGFDL